MRGSLLLIAAQHLVANAPGWSVVTMSEVPKGRINIFKFYDLLDRSVRCELVIDLRF